MRSRVGGGRRRSRVGSLRRERGWSRSLNISVRCETSVVLAELTGAVEFEVFLQVGVA